MSSSPARQLASRAMGGYSLASDVPAPGSLTVFQSSRVARPQDASKTRYLVSLLSSSARSHLDAYKQRTLRPVSEVSDMETRLEPAGRYVDPVFQHSRRHYVGFVRNLAFFRCQEMGPRRVPALGILPLSTCFLLL